MHCFFKHRLLNANEFKVQTFPSWFTLTQPPNVTLVSGVTSAQEASDLGCSVLNYGKALSDLIKFITLVMSIYFVSSVQRSLLRMKNHANRKAHILQQMKEAKLVSKEACDDYSFFEIFFKHCGVPKKRWSQYVETLILSHVSPESIPQWNVATLRIIEMPLGDIFKVLSARDTAIEETAREIEKDKKVAQDLVRATEYVTEDSDRTLVKSQCVAKSIQRASASSPTSPDAPPIPSPNVDETQDHSPEKCTAAKIMAMKNELKETRQIEQSIPAIMGAADAATPDEGTHPSDTQDASTKTPSPTRKQRTVTAVVSARMKAIEIQAGLHPAE